MKQHRVPIDSISEIISEKEYENAILSLYPVTDHLEAGCDEAGRGCLAGPVVAASVILPNGFKNQWLNDSKKLNEKRRNELRIIVESEAVSWGLDLLTRKKLIGLIFFRLLF